MLDYFLSVCRYVGGRPLDGVPRTDSTFLRRGTQPVGRRANRWDYLPGWKRAAWRLGTPTVLASGSWSYFTHPVETKVVAGAIAAGTTAEAARRVRRRVMHRRHRSTYLIPLHRTLARVVGDASVKPEQWISLPVNFADQDVESTVRLPKDIPFTREFRRAIEDVIRERTGLDPDFSWFTIGPRPILSFRPAPEPPGKLAWAAMAEAARKAKDTAPLLGMGPRGVLVDVDLEAESPHILISAGSGGGKSVLIKTLLAQALNRGAGAVILDYKRHSHRWADGLDGVVYAKDIEDIHETMVNLGAEGERRNRASDETGTCEDAPLWIVCEEMNATILKLSAYWQAIREKGDPVTSPAVAALRDLVFMGRAVRMHVLAVAQMMTARTLGGPEVRENFAIRCITRCSNNAIKMLAPEIMPIRKPRGLGRWLIVRDGVSTLTQVAFMTDDEARAWASAGVPNPSYVLTSQSLTTQGGEARTVSALLPLAKPATVTTVGLREAAPYISLSLDAIRKAAQRRRTNGFPEPIGQDGPEAQYLLEEIITWKRKREAVRVVNGKAA